MSTPSPTPPAARALIALVSLAGLAAVVYRLAGAGHPHRGDLLALALVALAVVVADRFPFDLPHGDDNERFMLSDGVWTAALLLTAAGVPTLAAVLGTAAGQLLARFELRKLAFNVGQVTLALTLAEAVYGLAGDHPDPLRPTSWALAAAAMAAASLVNFGSVALVIALITGEPLRRVALDPLRVNVIQWVGNVSLGLLAAVLWQVSPVGPVLLGLPLALLSLAYRDWVRSTIERNQMEQMMKGAEAIARERTFEARLPVGERDGRLPRLAIALNHMLDQQELAFHRQRRLMAEVAAQLHGPIGTLTRALDDRTAAGPDAGPATADGRLNGVHHPDLRAELQHVSRILDDMADIGSSQLPGFVQLRPVRVADVMARLVDRAEPFLGDRLQAAGPPSTALVALDRDRIEEALLRLLQNTADHGTGQRPVDLRAVEEDRAIRFEVVDQGGGVPAGQEDAIFEPFFRAGSRDGAGLGLAMVRTVAEAHGGSAGVVNRPGAGVTFWVRVPR